jgi:omega-hydroxy-beta-dihydromenaquinone-9 sulfotransferase
MTNGDQPSTVTGPGRTNAYPFYAPRLWHGMRFRAFWNILAENRFRMHPLRVPMACGVIGCSVLNSTLGALQDWRFGKHVDQLRLEHPPIFIIGHWRSGTTHLHELLSLDSRFTSPNTYECLAPEHFLLSGKILPPLISFLLPAKRPMDDMPVGFDRPQEDELALCAMGAPTPMTRMAFPNHPPAHLDMLDMQASPEDIEHWRRKLIRFIKSVSLSRPDKRLVLKSPPHTGRLAHLIDMFPGARFIHLSRDPQKLFLSTIRLWKALDEVQGFQIARHRELEEFVFTACERMYRGYAEQKDQVPAGQLHELKYEDLVRDPIGNVRQIYETLQLGDFAPVEEPLRQYLATHREYRPGRYQIDPELQARIRERWGFYFDRFGYHQDAEATPATTQAE